MKSIQIKILTISVLFILMIAACKVRKKSAHETFPFNYPDDITEVEKPAFVTKYDKGYVIYNLTCAKCHNKVVDGKTVIPTFSLPQLMDYEIRIQYPEHADPMRDTNLSAEELEQVIVFLRYKKGSQ